MAIPGNFLSSTTESVDPNTSGWVAKLNSVIFLGGGGRNGDGCLAVKSLASGEMQARTVSSYTVTAGTTYEAFADASGATVPERIGIRWLDWKGTELSITWAVTALAASASWHRISVAGAAPAGAMKAQVLLSSTPAAANVISYYENVYLGLPIRTTGNLLPYNTESIDVDATGWGVAANATISRQVPVVSWAVDNYTAGGSTLAMTVTANGNASVLAVDRPAVTPGTEYVGYAYLQPPTSGSTAWVELRFYNASGTQIAAQRSTLAAPGTGMYRQKASMVAPATAAKCSLAAGLDSATAGQVLRVETAVITVAPKPVAGSLLPYADTSFEQGVAGWTTASGVATLARTTPWGTSSYDGFYALAVTSSTATTSTIRSARFSGVTAGENHRAQVLVHPAGGSWTTVTTKIRWYDAANVDLGVSTGNAYSLPGSSWYALPTDAVAPAGATQGAIEVVVVAAAVSSVLHVDVAALWKVLPLTTVAAFSDDGYAQLTLRELIVDQQLSVYRELEDGSRTLVRGTTGLIDHQTITSDLVIVEDHEAPLNTPFRYYVEQLPVGSLIAATRYSDFVTITLDDVSLVWLKDPGNPQRNMRVMVQRAPDWQRPIEQTAFVVRGRRNKVVLSGVRQGLEGDLSVFTRSDDERNALHVLLDSGNTLLWQAAQGMGVSDMYVSVAQITEARTGGAAQDEWRVWTLPLTEADMPVTTGVNGAAGRTWQDILTEFATWQEVRDTFATWEDVFLDRRG